MKSQMKSSKCKLSLARFRSEAEDDYEYEFSVMSMRIRFGGRHLLKCARSERKLVLIDPDQVQQAEVRKRSIGGRGGLRVRVFRTDHAHKVWRQTFFEVRALRTETRTRRSSRSCLAS